MMAREELSKPQTTDSRTMLHEELESIYTKVHSKGLFERTVPGMIAYLQSNPFFKHTDLSTMKEPELERLCITTAAKSMERDEEIQNQRDEEYFSGTL